MFDVCPRCGTAQTTVHDIRSAMPRLTVNVLLRGAVLVRARNEMLSSAVDGEMRQGSVCCASVGKKPCQLPPRRDPRGEDLVSVRIFRYQIDVSAGEWKVGVERSEPEFGLGWVSLLRVALEEAKQLLLRGDARDHDGCKRQEANERICGVFKVRVGCEDVVFKRKCSALIHPTFHPSIFLSYSDSFLVDNSAGCRYGMHPACWP